jgi:hypothetical protein
MTKRHCQNNSRQCYHLYAVASHWNANSFQMRRWDRHTIVWAKNTFRFQEHFCSIQTRILTRPDTVLVQARVSVQFLYYENGAKSEYRINTLHANVPASCEFLVMGVDKSLSVIISAGIYNFDKWNLVWDFVSVRFVYVYQIFLFLPNPNLSLTM